MPAAVSGGPAVTLTAVTVDGGYARVHCRDAGWLPPLKASASDAVPPVVTEPDDRAREPDCALSGLLQNRHETKAMQGISVEVLGMDCEPPDGPQPILVVPDLNIQY